jgi:hypothetical protein
MKKCPKCQIVKDYSDFSKSSSRKDGFRVYCKKCSSIQKKNYDEKKIEKNKDYREKNKEKSKEYFKNYYLSKSDDLKNKAKNNYLLNKEAKIKYQKLYSQNNKEKINTYKRKQYKENIHISSWRSLLKNTLKRLNKKKESSTIELLGYSALDLKIHIEKLFTQGMSWNNYGEWHIDHIKPVVSFDKNTSVSVVCALSNLQPLWAISKEIDGIYYEGNLNKGSK